MTAKGKSGWRPVVLCVALLALSGAVKGSAAEDQEEFPYDDYAAALKQYVDDDGMLDYRGLKGDREKLDAFVARLGGLERKTYDGWSDEEKIAFWLNAYNGLTLKVIIDHYPIKPTFPASLWHPDNSIRQIKGVWDKIGFTVTGRRMTLDEMEHEVLRKEFDEPRIHMALVCAAMGCPPLLDEPWVGEKLDEQFAERTRRFLRNTKKFRIDRRKNRVYLSPILDWFGEDFIETYGTDTKFRRHGKARRAVLNYLSEYLDEEDRAYLATAKYKIKYLDYDWSLNEQKAPEK